MLKLTLNATLFFSFKNVLHKFHFFPKAKFFEIKENQCDRKVFITRNYILGSFLNFLLENHTYNQGLKVLKGFLA